MKNRILQHMYSVVNVNQSSVNIVHDQLL